MAENPNPFQNFKNQNNNNKPKKKLGFYWVYIVLIAFFIGSIVFGSVGSVKETTMTDLTKMLRDQDVAKIELVNGRTAEIYLNEQGLRKYFPNETPQMFGKSPNYTLKVSEDRLYTKVDEAQQDLANPIEVIPIERHNWGAEIISWVLPLLLLVGFWIFITRRMSGGSGMGGGQIFSIGKSKAQLYDQEKDNKTTFKDVAGLEEAKEEVMEIVDFLKNFD